jgi:hypothetical protein
MTSNIFLDLHDGTTYHEGQIMTKMGFHEIPKIMEYTIMTLISAV